LEHSQERCLIEEMEKDLRLSNLPDFAKSANVLSSTLRNHIYKEDRILFETTDQVLTPRDDDDVLQRLNHFETEEVVGGDERVAIARMEISSEKRGT
jgi:hemerythrin-like domain-containing protein